ncbi:MAG: hypothetical protein Q8O99_00755, partial [bacterium]|nr:hypothetical protein [bacterium]
MALPDELYSKPLQQLIDRYGSETARLRNNKFTDRTALTGVYDQIGTTLGGTPLPATAALFTKQVQTTQRLYAAHKQFRLPPKQESGQQTQEEQTQEEQTQEEQTQEEQTQEEQTQEEQTQEEQTQEEQTQEEQTQEEQTQEEQTQEEQTQEEQTQEEQTQEEQTQEE